MLRLKCVCFIGRVHFAEFSWRLSTDVLSPSPKFVFRASISHNSLLPASFLGVPSDENGKRAIKEYRAMFSVDAKDPGKGERDT